MCRWASGLVTGSPVSSPRQRDGPPGVPMVPGAWAAQAGAGLYQRLARNANKHCHEYGHHQLCVLFKQPQNVPVLFLAWKGKSAKTRVCVSMAALVIGTPGPLAPAAGPCLGQHSQGNGAGK